MLNGLFSRPSSRDRSAGISSDILFDCAPVGMAVYDMDGRYYRVNAKFCEMTGLRRDELLSPDFDWKAIFAEKLDETFAMVEEAAATGKPASGELVIASKGRRIETHSTAVNLPLKDRQGRPLQCVWHQDISELKAKRELAETSAYWEEIFEAQTEGLCVFDLDGGLHDFNGAYARLVGYTREELLEKGWLALTPKEYQQEEQKRLPEIMSGKMLRYEKEYIHKDGHLVPILVSYRMLKRRPDWEKDRLICTVVDLTEAKAKEEELSRIYAALESSDARHMVADANGVIVYANPSAQKLFADHRDEVRRRLPRFDPDKLVGSSYDLYHHDPAATRAVISGMEGTHQAEVTFGDHIFSLNANPVVKDGKRIGTAVEWRDITEETTINREIESLIEGIKEGDFSARIAKKEGRVARRMAETVNILLDETTSIIAYAQDCLGRLASAKIITDTEPRDGATRMIQQMYNDAVDGLQELVREVVDAAHIISVSSKELSQSQADLSERVNREAASLEEISANSEAIAAVFSENARHAQHTQEMALEVFERLVQGKETSVEVKDVIFTAVTGAKETTTIARAIQNMANTTHILSLNASIEAAREGSHGFAVIANEIRRLAGQVAQYSERAEGITAALIDAMGKGETGIQELASALDTVAAQAQDMTRNIEAVSQTIREQEHGIQELTEGARTMEEGLSQNAAMAEEIHATSIGLRGQTEALMQAVGRFQVGEGAAAATGRDKSLAMAVYGAIADHHRFREKLIKAASGEVRLDPQEVGDAHLCNFGQFLDGKGRDIQQCQRIRRLHEDFHVEARRIVSLINEGKQKETEQALIGNSRFNQMTEELVQAMEGCLERQRVKGVG